MVRSKSLKNITNYEKKGQKFFFGKDNLSFKTVNMHKKQHFDNICKEFKLKKIIKKIYLPIKIINIYKI